jgi:hypothetical protein
MSALFVYAAGATLATWGALHILNTKPVVASFGSIALDNRRILTMEWAAEGLAYISLGLLVILVAATEGSSPSATADLVYRSIAAALVAFAILTAATGSRTRTIWFKLCPFILNGAAALLVAGSLV